MESHPRGPVSSPAMNRFLPQLLMVSGMGISLLAVLGAAAFVVMGFGSSFAASSTEVADQVFQTMVIEIVGCVVALILGITTFVAGLVMWRRRKAAGA